MKAFSSAPSFCKILLYFSVGYFGVPRNIMCSKKWAKPDLPSSTSLRDPVRTTVQNEMTPGVFIGMLTRVSPLSRTVVSITGKTGCSAARESVEKKRLRPSMRESIKTILLARLPCVISQNINAPQRMRG